MKPACCNDCPACGCCHCADCSPDLNCGECDCGKPAGVILGEALDIMAEVLADTPRPGPQPAPPPCPHGKNRPAH